MRYIVLILLLVVLDLQAAVPQLSDFNTTQFQTAGGIVGVKSGAAFTNTTLVGSPTLNGIVLPYGAANYVVYGATNSTLPNSRVLSAGSNVTITESGTNLTVIAAAGGGTNGLPDPGGNGIVVRTATNTTVYQTIVGVANETVVTNGDGVLGAPTVALAPKARFLSFTNVAEMEAASVADGTPVILKGYYVEGDSPASVYVFIAGDTSTVDNGSVVTNAAGRFKLQPQGGRVDFRNFGAIADYSGELAATWTNTSTNVTIPAPLAINYIGKKIALRRGNTSVGAEVTLLASDLSGTTITSFTVVSNGQGYINIPTNILTSGPGSGATTTCVLTNGRLDSITVTGGGTGYTTNSIFKIRSTDCGTTNAPYHTEVFTVTAQSGTTIGLSGTPTFSSQLYPEDSPGVAILYSDNVTNCQAALDYANRNGFEVFIPAGEFVSGPLYVTNGARITGGNRDLTKMHLTPLAGITTFRKSLFTPNNVNRSNGRHIQNPLIYDCEFQGFTVDGEAGFQDPLGTSLNSGQFAIFGINACAVREWHIHDMTFTNCQGGSIYMGSFTPWNTSDWDGCKTMYLRVDHTLHINNWRQAHQLGNIQRMVYSDNRILDSSQGYYATQVARNLTAGSQVGQNGTYSPEQIDAEANAGATAGYNKFIHNWFENHVGAGINIFPDQLHTDFINNTWKDCRNGAVASSPIPISATSGNNQVSQGEWSSFINERFLITDSTLYGSHFAIRFRGVKVIGCTFEGKGNNAVGDIIFDSSGFGIAASDYEMKGFVFRDNTINLYDTAGSANVGIVNFTGNAAAEQYRDSLFGPNIWIAGRVANQGGANVPDADTLAVASRIGTRAEEGFSFQAAAGGSVNYKSETTVGGFGSTNWSLFLRFSQEAGSSFSKTELLRWGVTAANEIRLWRDTQTSNLFALDWNPSNNIGGARTMYVPMSALKGEHYSAWTLAERPINLMVTRTQGQVRKINVVTGGSGYTASANLALTFASGNATGYAQTDSSGVVTNAWVHNCGSGYTTNPVVTLTTGGGINATFTASAAQINFYLDGQKVHSDYGTDIITNMSNGGGNLFVGPSGPANARYYAVGMWNRALSESEILQVHQYGPHYADRWGTWGGTPGCVMYVKFNPGIGAFFEDSSSNGSHIWSQAMTTHGVPKRTGQILKRLAVTAATGGTNGINVAAAASAVIPAGARITSIYAIPLAGAAPTVRVGFDSAITDQLVAPATLTANTTNYLNLVPSMVYGTTNRPVYVGQTGAATNEIVINYSLDQGALDGSTIQSGIVTAPGGLGSTSAIAATAIDATGWTNTFGVNAMVYAEGTGLQFTVYNAAGTPVYTNAATVGSASIALQKGAKMIVIAGTGVSGRAVPW